MFRFEKPIFLKLYRYYLKKLFFDWLLLITIVFVFSFLQAEFWSFFRIGEIEKIWNKSWHFSLAKSALFLIISTNLIHSLVNQGQKSEDASILAISSPINRQNMFVAKIASFFTYYWASNLLFNLPVIFLSSKSSWNVRLVFFFFDSFFLILITFLLFSIPLFYLYFPARDKKIKFLAFFLYLAFPLLFLIVGKWGLLFKIFGKPWTPALYSLFVGAIFLCLYWDNFRQHDYT